MLGGYFIILQNQVARINVIKKYGMKSLRDACCYFCVMCYNVSKKNSKRIKEYPWKTSYAEYLLHSARGNQMIRLPIIS